MRRIALFALLAGFLASPAMAITEFNKQWRDNYLTDQAPAAFKTSARRAGCNVCHIKGEEKEEVRNEYGTALQAHLKAENFPKERIKDEPEKVKAEILEAFKKIEPSTSKDGKKFGEKIKAGELPATDAAL